MKTTLWCIFMLSSVHLAFCYVPRITEFWKTANEEGNYVDKALSKYPSMIEHTNQLITSVQDKWADKMSTILSDIDSIKAEDKAVALRVVYQFLRQENIPSDVCQVLHHWLMTRGKMTGLYEISQIMEHVEGRYMDHIRSISDPTSFSKFVKMQRRLEDRGVLNIDGEYTWHDKKVLYEFWISDRTGLYYEIKYKPTLQLALQSQLIQNRLIEIKHSDDQISEIPHQFLAWTLTRTINHVASYIRSLKTDRQISQFIKTQKVVRPYGLEIDINNDRDQLKVIRFWLTHLEIFLLIDRIEETKTLQKVIENFVVKDFDEVSMIMGKFLADPPTGTTDNPVLAQFLAFYLVKTKYPENNQAATQALKFFKNTSNRK